MPPNATTADQAPCAWRVFRSDKGRWWACRTEPFTRLQEHAGAARTVDADNELGLARAMAEQESRAVIAEAVPDAVTDQVRQQITLLSQTYPAWRFIRETLPNGTPGGWHAYRYAPLSHAQRTLGLLPTLYRKDADSLILALDVQDQIAHQHRYSAGRSG